MVPLPTDPLTIPQPTSCHPLRLGKLQQTPAQPFRLLTAPLNSPLLRVPMTLPTDPKNYCRLQVSCNTEAPLSYLPAC